MTGRVQYGGVILIAVGGLIGMLFGGFFLPPYRDIMACAAVGLFAWMMTIQLNAPTGPVTFLGSLTRKDRRHLFWLYLVAALLFSLGAVRAAWLLWRD